jgi:PAS domain-containing protein
VPDFSTILLLELTTLLICWLLASAWQRSFQISARRLFIGLSVACAAWCIGDLCEHSGALDPSNASRIAFLGMLSFGPLWLALGAQAADLGIAQRAAWLGWLLALPALAIYALLYDASLAHPYLSVAAGEPGAVLPLPLATAIYLWAQVAVGSGFFLVAALQPDASGRWWRRLSAALAGFVLVAVDVVSLFGGMQLQFQPTPIAAGVALWMLHIAIFSGGLLGALPTSRFELLDLIPLPILVADRYGAVVASNPAARARLGLDAHNALWRSIDTLLAESHDRPDVGTWPLIAAGREVAALVLIDPPAKPRDPDADAAPAGADPEAEVGP